MDTLQIDTAAVSAWRANSDYDYEREFARSGDSLWDRLWDAIRNAFDSAFGKTFDNMPDWAIWAIIGGLALIVVVVLIFIYKPKIFFRNRKSKLDYSVTEDNIYGVDFEKEINKAVAGKNWREAVRLTYLRTLRLLSDNKLIDWQIFKTPTQYTREFRFGRFIMLSNLFLRVRYGSSKAIEADYVQATTLAENVSEEVVKRNSMNGETKGGEA